MTEVVSLDEEPILNIANENGTMNLQLKMKKIFSIQNRYVKEFLAEVLGTAILVGVGCGSIAQKFFSPDHQNPFAPNVVFGLSAMTAGIIVGKVSGAHINPAVSLAMFLIGRMSALRMFIYFVAQMLGGFLGALLVYLNYYQAIHKYGLNLDTAAIFATYPTDYLGVFNGFFDQVIGTAFLLIAVLGITDPKNNVYSPSTMFLLVGAVVTIHGAAFSSNCGGAINPARDLPPRILTLMTGWGDEVFTTGNYFFWIPVIGPMVGACVGTFIYYFMVGNNWD